MRILRDILLASKMLSVSPELANEVYMSFL